MTDKVDAGPMARAPFRLAGPAVPVPESPGTYRIPAGQWAKREAAADRLEQLARNFFDADADEAASWFITGWPRSIVADSEVTSCREWLVVKASQGRIHAFYDLITGTGVISSWSADGNKSTFTPANS